MLRPSVMHGIRRSFGCEGGGGAGGGGGGGESEGDGGESEGELGDKRGGGGGGVATLATLGIVYHSFSAGLERALSCGEGDTVLDQVGGWVGH